MTRDRGDRRPLPPGFRVLWVTVVIDAIGFGIVVPILGLYAEDFGASAAVVGLLVASFSLAQLVASPVLGRWSDRVGRRPLIIVSLVGTAVGSLITGLAGSLAWLFVGRVVDGASGASVAVARASAADLATPEDRARLFGLLGAAMGLGFVVGPVLGSLAALGDPRLPFFLAAAIAGVNAAVAVVRLPETRAETRPETRAESSAEPAAPPPNGAPPAPDLRRTFFQLLVVSFVTMAAFAGFEATFPLLLEDRLLQGSLDEELRTVGLVFAAMGLAIVVVRARLVQPAIDRLGERGSLRAGLIANAAGLGVLGVAHGWPLVAAGLLLLVAGQGILLPVLTSEVAGVAETGRAGGALGWQQSVQSAGRIAGPILAGVLADQAGFSTAFAVAAALSLAALLVVPSARDPAAPVGGVAGGAGLGGTGPAPVP